MMVVGVVVVVLWWWCCGGVGVADVVIMDVEMVLIAMNASK